MSRDPERHGMRCMIRALGETRVEERLRAVRARACLDAADRMRNQPE